MAAKAQVQQYLGFGAKLGRKQPARNQHVRALGERQIKLGEADKRLFSFGKCYRSDYDSCTATVLETQTRRWTYQDYAQPDDDLRHEIIDGTLLISPAPDTWHQSWLGV